MAGSTIPLVIDTLLARWQALTFTLPDPTAEQLLIADGWPGTYQPPVVLTIGGTTEHTAQGEQLWAGLGAKRKWEIYEIHCVCSALIGGYDPSNPEAASDAQKTARDAAFAVVHTVEADMIADPTLGQIFPLGGWVGVKQIALKQTDDADAAEGATADVTFAVEVKTRI